MEPNAQEYALMPSISDAILCLGRVLCPKRSKIAFGSIDNRMCPFTPEFGRFWKKAGRLGARTRAPEFVGGGLSIAAVSSNSRTNAATRSNSPI